MDALLSQAPSVFVHLDPRRDKVVVPPQFRKQPMLVLEIGLNMRVPIPDLEIDEESIGCTLSFGGRPYWCRMPWEAVFALVTSERRGMIWPPDVPPEVADRFMPPPAAKAPPPKKPGPKLVAVSDEPPKEASPSAEQEEPDVASQQPAAAEEPRTDAQADEHAEEHEDEEQGDSPTKRKLPSYLRVVK